MKHSRSPIGTGLLAQLYVDLISQHLVLPPTGCYLHGNTVLVSACLSVSHVLLYECLGVKELYECLWVKELHECLGVKELYECLGVKELYECLGVKELYECLGVKELYECLGVK